MGSPTCYNYASGIYNDTFYDSFPCGNKNSPGLDDPVTGFQSCCHSGDECGANNICKWGSSNSSADHPAHGSGYYVGGCTDPTFQAPMCRHDCKTFNSASDIVFLENGTWACCGKTNDGSNEPNCSAPLLDQAYDLGWAASQFPGPINAIYTPAATMTIASLDVKATSSVSSSNGGGGSSTAPSTSTLAPNASTSASAAVASSSGLTTGAKAGIGVGLSLGVLILVAIVIVFALRHKRRRTPQCQPVLIQAGYIDPGTRRRVEVSELASGKSPGHQYFGELDSSSRTHELDA